MTSLLTLSDHSFRIIARPSPRWQALLAPALHRRHRKRGRAGGCLHEPVAIQGQLHDQGARRRSQHRARASMKINSYLYN
eukprot:COSAG06_NODE_50465_length_318_cov_1.086758_1_plen_79_part_10